MSLAEEARAASHSFEGVKAAYRQTDKGMALTIVVHPSDLPAPLATDPLGTRYQVAMVKLDDTSPTVSRDPVADMKVRSPDSPPQDHTNSGSPHAPAEGVSPRSILARERYRNSSAAQQAKVLAGILPTDERFRKWANCASEEEAAEFIRDNIGGSRSMIDGVYEFYARFMTMYNQYLIDTGKMATPR